MVATFKGKVQPKILELNSSFTVIELKTENSKDIKYYFIRSLKFKSL